MSSNNTTKKSTATLLTFVFSVSYSVLLILLNLIYTKMVIRGYGSDVNGLISTLNQFVNLFMIVEGGFTTAAVVALFGPIIKDDVERINDTLYTCTKVYRKIGGLIALFVLPLGVVYVRSINSPMTVGKTFILLAICALSSIASVALLSPHFILFQALNREYTQIIITIISKIISWVLSIVLIAYRVDILIVYSINVLYTFMILLLMLVYEKKRYKKYTFKGKYHREYISGTGHVLFQKITSTIFTSTDLILISVCIDLFFASVYNLYFQIFRACLVLLSAFCQAPFNSFGQLAKEKDNDSLYEYFDVYQQLIVIISTIILVTVGIMVIPFIKLYTINVTDHNYVYPVLAVLFFSQIFAQIINRPYGSILNATGHFEMQNKQCALAAVVNIVVSIAFISKYGVYSVIFGSFVATLIILIANIIQVYKNVFSWKSSVAFTFTKIIINFIAGVALIMFSWKLELVAINYLSFFFKAVLIFIILSIIFVILNLLIDRKGTLSAIKTAKDMIMRIFAK